jgi:CHAT domain-containing protein/tetratricopeptide (TPR) repeat protein
MTIKLVLRAAIVIAILTLMASNSPRDARAQGTDDLTRLSTQFSQLFTQGKFAEAAPIGERYVAVARKRYGENHPNFASGLNNLAEVYRVMARYAEAETLHRRAVAIREKTLRPNHPDIAQSLNNLALLYQAQGRYAEAEPLYKPSLAIREKAFGPDHPYVAASLNNLAELYRLQGRYAEAEPLLKRSLAINEKALGPEHPYVGGVLNILAVLYGAQGRYAEAEPPCRRALAIFEKAFGTDHPDVASTLDNLAVLYQAQGRTEVEPLMKRALATYEKAYGPDHPDVGRSLLNLALLYRAQGRYAEAEPLYKRALAIAERATGPDHPDVANSLDHLAGLAIEQRNWVQAAAYWQRATQVIERRVERGLTGSEGGSVKGEAVQNSRYFSGLVKIMDRLAPQGRADRARLGREMFETAQWVQASDAATSLTQMAARSAKGDTALAALVRERQDLTGEWQARDKQLIAAKSLPRANRNTGAEKMLSDRLAAIDGRLSAIDAQFAKDFPEYASLTSPKATSLTEVQTQLRDDEALVLFLDTHEFEPIPEETFIWVVTKGGMRWVKSALGTKALSERVEALRCGLDPAPWDEEKGRARCRALVGAEPGKNGLLPFDLRKARELYEALFGAIRDEITGKRLLIVPSAPLAMLPFGVLVTEAPPQNLPKTADGYSGISWLGVENAITVLPSVSSLSALRKLAKGNPATEPFIGFGDPALQGNADCGVPSLPTCCPGVPGRVAQRIASSGLVHRGVTRAAMQNFFNGNLARVDVLRAQCPLPETAFELKCVAQSLGVPESRIQLREKATETGVKTAPLDRYQIVYFATHGLLASETKQATGSLAEPALLLSPPPTPTEADDGLLTASEITQLKLNADWVVLSACNTAGAADMAGGETLSGLARAFFYAGARALLVSHWAVDSDATVLLTTRTFAELKSNPSIGRAEALRRAMQAVISDKSRPDAAHPSFWAPFVVVGEGAAR